MHRTLCALVPFILAATPAFVRAADNYTVDAAHTSVSFKISHLGLSWTHGRFNEVSGAFAIDAADPAKSSFTLNIKPESIDTGNRQRDDHLRSPDFLNVKQFPALSFKSTAVKAAEGGYAVTGDFTLHGVTKSITFHLTGGKMAEFPPGTKRTGYSTDLVLKRSDFGVGAAGPIGDDVHVSISFEGTSK
jgi:polyisoprenoid-binding protein YceI